MPAGFYMLLTPKIPVLHNPMFAPLPQVYTMPAERRNRSKNNQNYTSSPEEIDGVSRHGNISGSPVAAKCRPSRACLGCRQIKMKCVRTDDNDDSCVRCRNAGRECIVMIKQVGRRPGSKNKYTDINKLLRRIENEALATNRAKNPNSEAGNRLESILAEALQVYRENAKGSDRTCADKLLEKLDSVEAEDHNENNRCQLVHEKSLDLPFTPSMIVSSFSAQPFPADTCSINSTELSKGRKGASCEKSPSSPSNSSFKNFSNPLKLLSQATDVLRRSDDGSSSPPNSGIPELDGGTNMHNYLQSPIENAILDDLDIDFLHNTLSVNISKETVRSGIDYLNSVDPPRKPHSLQHDLLPSGLEYFGSSSNSSRFDVNDKDLDPIHLSLITEEEVQGLFNYFYTEPVNLCFCLDPEYFTPAFVRSDSLFLLTAICFCASQFAPSSDKTLAKRLEIHFHRSAELVIARGYRSVSIVSAFCIGSGWTTPAQKISQEKSWMYLSHASALALELGVNACFKNSSTHSETSVTQGRELVAVQDELEYHGVSPDTDLARRILRSKQRTWLHLYLWGSGLALTLKRPWIIRSNEVPISPLWHKDRLAATGDNALACLVMLRRTTEYVLKEMAEISASTNGPNYQIFRTIIDSKLDSWHQEWLGSTSSEEYSSFPIYLPYPALLFKHGKLLLVGAAIKHCYGGNEIPNDVVLDGLKVALSVCKIIVDELSTGRQLKFFPNNVALMSLYAAVCALQLLSMAQIKIAQKMHIFGMLGQEAFLLEKVGSFRKCSFGMPTLYGRHLKALLNSAATQMIPSLKQNTNDNNKHSDWINDFDTLFDPGSSFTMATTENTSEAPIVPDTNSMAQPVALDEVRPVSVLDISSTLSEDSMQVQNNLFGKESSMPSGPLQLGAGSNTLFGFGFSGDIFDPMDLSTGDDFFHTNNFLQ